MDDYPKQQTSYRALRRHPNCHPPLITLPLAGCAPPPSPRPPAAPGRCRRGCGSSRAVRWRRGSRARNAPAAAPAANTGTAAPGTPPSTRPATAAGRSQGSHGVTGGHRGSHGVTRGQTGSHGVTRGHTGSDGVTGVRRGHTRSDGRGQCPTTPQKGDGKKEGMEGRRLV